MKRVRNLTVILVKILNEEDLGHGARATEKVAEAIQEAQVEVEPQVLIEQESHLVEGIVATVVAQVGSQDDPSILARGVGPILLREDQDLLTVAPQAESARIKETENKYPTTNHILMIQYPPSRFIYRPLDFDDQVK